MKNQVRIFFTALMFYTRIPCPPWVDHSPEFIRKATRFFPLMGWIVGGFAALIYLGASQVFDPTVSILLSMIASIWITGAFHEDGWADMCDGFGGGWTKEKILDIMKDSRVGAFGVIGLIGILSLKFAALNSLPTRIIPYALLFSHSMSRFVAVVMIFTLPYARDERDSKAKPVAEGISWGEFITAGIFAFLPMILLQEPVYLLAILPMVPVYLYFRRMFKRWIGGYTGDCLGATQQLAEVIAYLAIFAVWKFT